MPELWDPLTYDTLMAGTVAHFEKQERIPLESVAGVKGPGIYALYYEGVMAEHRPIAVGRGPSTPAKRFPRARERAVNWTSNIRCCGIGSGSMRAPSVKWIISRSTISRVGCWRSFPSGSYSPNWRS